MLQRLNHERDQQALAILHLRRDHENLIRGVQREQQRFLFDLVFHGDYEKYREKLELEIKQSHFLGRIAERDIEMMMTTTDQQDDKYISICVKDSMGKLLTTLSVERHVSLGEFKYALEDRLLIPPQKMRLFFKGNKLNDGPSLDDYAISEGATIHLRTSTRDDDMRNVGEKDSMVIFKVKRFFREQGQKDDKHLEKLFDELDGNSDGIIPVNVLKKLIYARIPSITSDELSELMDILDSNRSGFITKAEWLQLTSLI